MTNVKQMGLSAYIVDPCPTCDQIPSVLMVEEEHGQYIDFMKVHPNWNTISLLPCEHRIGEYTIQYNPAAPDELLHISYKALEHVNLIKKIKDRKRMLL